MTLFFLVHIYIHTYIHTYIHNICVYIYIYIFRNSPLHGKTKKKWRAGVKLSGIAKCWASRPASRLTAVTEVLRRFDQSGDIAVWMKKKQRAVVKFGDRLVVWRRSLKFFTDFDQGGDVADPPCRCLELAEGQTKSWSQAWWPASRLTAVTEVLRRLWFKCDDVAVWMKKTQRAAVKLGDRLVVWRRSLKFFADFDQGGDIVLWMKKKQKAAVKLGGIAKCWPSRPASRLTAVTEVLRRLWPRWWHCLLDEEETESCSQAWWYCKALSFTTG